ncbi:MAG: hypothetical protein QNM02_14815 [Acidimicrobiia bacterium]|nr:hypothetical protein [Acidimicrobiia bacterium]
MRPTQQHHGNRLTPGIAARSVSGTQRTRGSHMLKHSLATLAIASIAVATFAGSAQAAPPERGEVPVFETFFDSDDGIVALWNITRDDLCDWAAGGFVGPPPVVQLIPGSTRQAGPSGELVGQYRGTSSVEIWLLNDPANPVNPCVDTEGQDGPFASGEAMGKGNDNDLDNVGSRRNSFGANGQGTITDINGDDWHLNWTFRNQCDVDCEIDFTSRAANVNLTKLGR